MRFDISGTDAGTLLVRDEGKELAFVELDEDGNVKVTKKGGGGIGKKILLGVVGVIIALIVIGSFGEGGNQASSNAPIASEKTPVEPTVITAAQLADDYDTNAVAAEATWKGKLVQFSATISNITDSGLSFYNVAGKPFSLTQIACRVIDKQQLLPLKNGQTVTVSGIVGGQTIGVIVLTDCTVVGRAS